MKKPVQYFDKKYLEHTKKLSADQIAEFLENYRLMHAKPSKSKLISIKIPEHLLNTFRSKCEQEGSKYQTKIKELMSNWLK
ncbi:MAG: hypothetical protein R3A13_10285 [Bdellovibrionota bacterium]